MPFQWCNECHNHVRAQRWERHVGRVHPEKPPAIETQEANVLFVGCVVAVLLLIGGVLFGPDKTCKTCGIYLLQEDLATHQQREHQPMRECAICHDGIKVSEFNKHLDLHKRATPQEHGGKTSVARVLWQVFGPSPFDLLKPLKWLSRGSKAIKASKGLRGVTKTVRGLRNGG